jgi:hypothetical protein
MSNRSLHELFYHLENELLMPITRKSSERLEQLLADDFTEFGSSGRIFTKESILKRLPNEQEIHFEMTNFKVEKLAEDLAMTTFIITKDVGVKYTLRSSIWKKNNGKWQMKFHQGTPMEQRK